ncbi:hypothetical protein NIES2135_64460 (plasmid) [Leptolyngbya boryana NIES-2135]|jgi:hypothetical protein|uniref:HNH nuclease domain-containing protein n=1 Tax=Leptolyngbya boryana NIES-2135 TaxID=1973484 RepID=A0A1Z4JS60_LEPBY|nr:MULTISPECIES: HNH endonuclease domain-containing protein [Leptolyngbya]BAY59569.1 hypothetical protein NIES2135_64460 [Leptolyngbya boryana NIES-2135]MBD2371144.1 hypothetical protein [Leptolyngbya sp. FACHB-161]MBD2377612.1 hypothetical protein [Leptolyngbya sp. FACHB-238]MBD2402058.1 hypothetical protein [Leptolyngbya sp. FACHB-239]MBD2408577.1 hypothetical protein [Leptolyngbya sp. FACHB-402]
MSLIPAGSVISTILKHDSKQTSYKIALLRAINDIVLMFPDLRNSNQAVAIPLRMLAERWVAYYWPFVQRDCSIWQGPRSFRDGVLRSDLSFRASLTILREQWEHLNRGLGKPSDGFFIVNELRVPRKRQTYPVSLLEAYDITISAIRRTIEQPIRYAGAGEWSVFDRPTRLDRLEATVVAVPSSRPHERCVVVSAELWQTFQSMSLWVEALCIHEWCLFSETVDEQAERGHIYSLLTDRPDNRRPLTWERNKIDLLILEGHTFICPWTHREITPGVAYDLDHLMPVSIYPINELWNLVPADPKFNSHVKRDRLPTIERLQQAQPYFELAYSQYSASESLSDVLREDAEIRFSQLQQDLFAASLAHAVADFIEQVAETRNLSRFG